MSIKLRVTEEDERDKWDAMVEASPHGAIFHTWKWLKIMEKHTGSKLYPLIGLKGTTPIGVFPLFYQKKFLIKAVFSPPPNMAIHHLGPLLVDYDNLKQDKKESIFIEFQKQVDDFISSELKPNYIHISSPSGLLDSRPFKWTGYQVEPMYNYLIDLSKGKDYVWGQFKKRLRQNINRAEKRGISIEEGSKEELEMIYDSFIARYEEQHKIPSLSKGYLLDLYEVFSPKNLNIFIAKYKEEFAGGIIDIYYKDKVVSWLGNAKANVDGISPNEIVQWEAIKWAIEHGFKYYEELGGNTPRLCPFKTKYNPNLSIYFSAKKYSSFFIKQLETVYRQMFKPVYEKLKSRTMK